LTELVVQLAGELAALVFLLFQETARQRAVALLRCSQAVLRLLQLLEVCHHPVGFVRWPIGREVLLGRNVIGIAADPIADNHQRVHEDHLA